LLVKLGYIDGVKFTLNRSLLKSVVKHYLRDLQILKIRYGIEDKVLPQKVAGLTAAAVARFKPVLPKDGTNENLFDSEENEILSIFHGLCVCSEQGDGRMSLQAVEELWTRPEFSEWLLNLRYLLKFRGYTAESLAMVFDTLIRFVK
jgi:hypothetical protein